MRKHYSVVGPLLATVIAAFGLAACGSSKKTESTASSAGSASTAEASSSGEISIDVGTKTIKFPAGTKPSIAMFAGSGNSYQEAQRKTDEVIAKEKGWSFTFFDSKFEASEQLHQLQTALTNKQFNTFIFEDYAGPATCPGIKSAAGLNIVVVQVTVPTCNQAAKPAGKEDWTPGTLTTVGGATTTTYYESFAAKIAEDTKGKHVVVGLVNGPPAITTSTLLKEALSKHGLAPVQEVNTNYTTPDALAKTQTMLQGQPSINLIASIYTESTLGAIRAIESQGKPGKIAVYDLGGSSENAKAIQQGKQTLSAPYYPKSVGEASMQAIGKAFANEPVERFYNGFAEGTAEKPFFLTKESLGSFKAQY